jgi:hypothetical protein
MQIGGRSAARAIGKEKVMFTMLTENTRRTVSAVAVVAFTGLTLDQGHLGTLPQGTVEVGELTAVNVMQMASVTLPGITVTAARSQAGQVAAARHQQSALLPTLAAAALAAADDSQAGANNASTPSVLLK